MFNVQGSEMIFLLLIALVVLGPEKLPEAVRKFTKTYAEFKKTIGGFQTEFRDAMDEPMRELRETANAVRDAAKFDLDGADAAAMEKVTPAVSEVVPMAPTILRREEGLNFGSANPRRQDRAVHADTPTADAESGPESESEAHVVEPQVAETAPIEDATE